MEDFIVIFPSKSCAIIFEGNVLPQKIVIVDLNTDCFFVFFVVLNLPRLSKIAQKVIKICVSRRFHSFVAKALICGCGS